MKFCAIFLFAVSVSFAQPAKDSISLFYDIDKVEPVNGYKQLENALANPGAKYIAITGYADFLGGAIYNKTLSEKRVTMVKNFITKMNRPDTRISENKGLGEKYSHDNGSAEGEKNWRRVDVIITGEITDMNISTSKESREEKPAKKNYSEIKDPAVNEVDEKEITELEEGESIAIEGLNFVPGKHVIVPSAAPVLKELLQTMKENPTLKIEIHGHICCSDDQADGFDFDTQTYSLSTNRARVVYEYLIKNGIKRDRLTYKGFGHTQPKVKELTPEDEQMNRRVEIKVIEK